MIERLIGESEAGIYSLAYSVSQIMAMLNVSINNTLNPWIFQKIKDRQTWKIANVGYAALIMVAAANLLLMFLAPEIIHIFAPAEYYNAIWVIPPVAMSVYFQFAYSLFANFEFYFEKTKFIAVASFAAAILNIVLNGIFIPLFGYFAAGYTTLICFILSTLGHYMFMQRTCRELMENEKVYAPGKLMLITLLFLAAGFFALATYQNAMFRYMSVLIAFALLAVQYKKIYGYVRNFLQMRKEI